MQEGRRRFGKSTKYFSAPDTFKKKLPGRAKLRYKVGETYD